jgi:branched-chain amino acid transport system ATP-binding protein
MTSLENVRVALLRRKALGVSYWRSQKSLRRLDPEAMDLLERVGLAAWADTEAIALPYGRKRALELATTLALDPKLMLLDEPFAGMAHGDVERMAELVKSSATGRTVLMVEHTMSAVASICDRISVLARGRLLAEGSYKDVTSNPKVIEAYLGDLH